MTNTEYSLLKNLIDTKYSFSDFESKHLKSNEDKLVFLSLMDYGYISFNETTDTVTASINGKIESMRFKGSNKDAKRMWFVRDVLVSHIMSFLTGIATGVGTTLLVQYLLSL